MFDGIRNFQQQKKQKEEQSPEQIILQKRVLKMIKLLSPMGAEIDRTEILDGLKAEDRQESRQETPLGHFQLATSILEKRGLIARHNTGRRNTHISLTEAGLAFLDDPAATLPPPQEPQESVEQKPGFLTGLLGGGRKRREGAAESELSPLAWQVLKAINRYTVDAPEGLPPRIIQEHLTEQYSEGDTGMQGQVTKGLGLSIGRLHIALRELRERKLITFEERPDPEVSETTRFYTMTEIGTAYIANNREPAVPAPQEPLISKILGSGRKQRLPQNEAQPSQPVNTGALSEFEGRVLKVVGDLTMVLSPGKITLHDISHQVPGKDVTLALRRLEGVGYIHVRDEEREPFCYSVTPEGREYINKHLRTNTVTRVQYEEPKGGRGG